MRRVNPEYDDTQAEADRITLSLASLAVTLFLVVVGLVLVQHLSHKARLEDCLMAGRGNCDVLLDGPPQ